MGTVKILRRSISKLLKDYHYFTIVPTLCILPFSISLLLSQAHHLLFPSSRSLSWFEDQLATLFTVAGFPVLSGPYFMLALKVSETVTSFIRTLHFTVAFLLLGRSLTLQFLVQSMMPSAHSLVLMYVAILRAYVCGLMTILSANATAFFIMFLAFDCLKGLGMSSPVYSTTLSFFGVLLYSVLLSYTFVVCNLAVTLSGVQKCGGCISIMKACLLVRRRKLTAMSLAVPTNLLLAATESLFQHRVATLYQRNGRFGLGMVSEGLFIAYWYSVFIVLETVISYRFLTSHQVDNWDDDTSCNDIKIWLPR